MDYNPFKRNTFLEIRLFCSCVFDPYLISYQTLLMLSLCHLPPSVLSKLWVVRKCILAFLRAKKLEMAGLFHLTVIHCPRLSLTAPSTHSSGEPSAQALCPPWNLSILELQVPPLFWTGALIALWSTWHWTFLSSSLNCGPYGRVVHLVLDIPCLQTLSKYYCKIQLLNLCLFKSIVPFKSPLILSTMSTHV